MGERTRKHAQRDPASTRTAAPTRTSDADTPDHASPASNPLLDLQASAGNRAVTQLIVQRGPGADAPLVTVPTVAEQATSDLLAAEAWLRFVGSLGNTPLPTKPVTGEYRTQLAIIQSAVGGPGPIPAAELKATVAAIGTARTTVARKIVARMQADHERLLPKSPTDAYDSIDLALDQGEENIKSGDQPRDQRDQMILLLALQSSANAELTAARSAGYQIPKALAELPSDAAALLKVAQEGYANGAPLRDKMITPQAELDLASFIEHASETINSTRGRRIADIARARRREADALWEAGNQQMEELRVILADKRRSAFMAGDDDALDDVSKAMGEVAGAIDDTRSAASIITDRVDQLNALVSTVSKSGKGLISLPDVPEGMSKVADKLESANKKIKLVIELLDLVGPAKTTLDEGLKYLKGVDMALEGFASKSANPFITVYVGAYLSPGIKNCMASIGSIANSISSSNRAAIEIGEAARITNWSTEPGGEQMYIFLASVYRLGGAAPLGNSAWEYMSDHRGDLSAAVGDPMPKTRTLVPAWASKNRRPLWESFYGSTKPPR